MWKIIVGAVVVLIAGSFLIAEQAAKKANEGVELQTWVAGNPDAPIVLTEYSDLQCPACAQFHPVVKDILEQYGNQIRFEYKHFPLISIHPYAVSAARAAEAAGQQGMFFEMHDLLFENQNDWSRSTAPDAFFVQYAEELGLDTCTFKRHLGSSVISDAITQSFRDAQAKGYTSTPAFELNGVRMNYESFEDFVTQIETALGVAETLEETAEEVDSAAGDTGVRFGL